MTGDTKPFRPDTAEDKGMADNEDLKPFQRLQPLKSPSGTPIGQMKPPIGVRKPDERSAHALEYIADALYKISLRLDRLEGARLPDGS